MSDEVARCRSCGALLAPDATWCGQCYAPVAEPEPEPELVPAPPPPATAAPPRPAAEAPVASAEPWWPCTVCGGRNPLEADACTTCGTPFAAVMRDEPVREPVEPRDAVVRSLLFPGLGHRALGYPTEGVARGALFVVSLGMAIMTGLAGSGTGAATAVCWLFVLTAIGTYVLSAVEADRLARGGGVFVAGRVLMWVVVGEVFLAIIVLAISIVSATRR